MKMDQQIQMNKETETNKYKMYINIKSFYFDFHMKNNIERKFCVRSKRAVLSRQS